MKQRHSRHGWGKCLFFGLLIMISMTAVAWAQPIEQHTINYIEASAAPDQFANQVCVYVTVSDDNQNPIKGLSALDFRALEDGKEVAIDAVTTATDPMALVLAIDTSGSMQARDKSNRTSMDAAKSAAVEFVSLLPKGDRVALFTFNNEPILQMDFSADHDSAISAINALAAKTNAATCLYDTAYEAVKKAAEIPKGRRAIILLTDGKDEKGGQSCSTHNANDVIDIATTKAIRVPIYTIGVGPKVDIRELSRIAGFTGGRNLTTSSLAELNSFYQTIADQLKNQYLLKYISRSPSGEHSLVVKVRHNNGWKQDEKRFWSPPVPVLQPLVINFVSPKPTDQINGTVTVTTNITPNKALAKVRYYVDGALKEELTAAPFNSFQWDTSGLSTGLHILRVEAIGINGRTGAAELTLKVASTTPAVQSAPTTVVKVDKRSILILVCAGGVLILLIGLIVWWVRRQENDACTPEPEALHDKIAEDAGDETIFMDDPDKEFVPPASIKVVKSLCLEPGTTFKVTDATRIGRTSKNDIDIPDKPVSRSHGEIYFYNGMFHIRDLGSKNGIKVDGKKIASESTLLCNGAKIHLGPQTVLQFHTIATGKSRRDDKTKIYSR